MPVRGVKLVYEVLGDSGPWIVISPGGRRGLASDRAPGVALAEAGMRVPVCDRRNTGASEIGFPGQSESHEQAEDLRALPKALGTGPVYVAGGAYALMSMAGAPPPAFIALAPNGIVGLARAWTRKGRNAERVAHRTQGRLRILSDLRLLRFVRRPWTGTPSRSIPPTSPCIGAAVASRW
jgi:hypothetical protein